MEDHLQREVWSHFQRTPSVFAGSENRLAFLLRVIKNSLSPANGTILNIGSGSGYLELSAINFAKVISVDPDERVVSRLKHSGVDARTGCIEKLPVASTSVDVVVASEVLEHLFPETLEAGLLEIKRVLKRGGLFLGTVPFNENLAVETVYCPSCRESFHRWGHRQSFTVEKLTRELAQHFSVRTLRPIYFAPWKVLNWKGKIGATLVLIVSRLGWHGHGENIFFHCVRDP